MRTRWAGATGRYTPSCENGVCARTGDRATSKLEGQIFTLLDYVLGPGEQDVRCFLAGRGVRIDMTFPLLDGTALVVEYDGAHWHECKEDADWRKSRAIEAGWGRYHACYVLRIREAPLRCLTEADVRVPARSDAITCVRLTLLHLLHRPALPYETSDRVIEFLRSGFRPLGRDQILCRRCRGVARQCMPPHLLIPTLRKQKRDTTKAATTETDPEPDKQLALLPTS